MKEHKYNYYISKNTVIATAKYAGRTYRGVAKCDPSDTFDLEYGKKLAALRCAKKISDKRAKHAKDRMFKAQDLYLAGVKEHSLAEIYLHNALKEQFDLDQELSSLLEN